MESTVKREVLEIIDANPELADSIKDKSFLITGSTGMIGRYVTSLLAENLQRSGGSGRLSVSARNQAKAKEMFGDYLAMDNFELVIGDVGDLTDVDGDVDYVIHAASPTQPQDFLDRPVDIIQANVFATNNLLELARAKSARFCLLSTLEIYGKVEAYSYPAHVTESDFGALDSLSLRSAYPESKRLAENLCVAFRTQFGVPSTIVRLAPTVSPLIEPDDKRVYAQFIHDAAAGRDITVYSDVADKERSYTYIADAVAGILIAILKSTDDNYVFNLANNDNIASIKKLAETVIANSHTGSTLRIVDREMDANTSNATGMVVLDSSKLLDAGWVPRYSLDDCVSRTFDNLSGES